MGRLGELGERDPVTQDLVIEVLRGRALYEAPDAWHHHFVCRRCGSVADVACVRGAKPCLEAQLPGVVVDEAQVIFRGVCSRCASDAAG